MKKKWIVKGHEITVITVTLGDVVHSNGILHCALTSSRASGFLINFMRVSACKVRLLSFPERNPEEDTPLSGHRLYATAACRYDREHM